MAIVAGAPAWAHHSFAVFFGDDSGLVTLKGTVAEFQFKNPHGLIRLTVKGEGGAAAQSWNCETNAPSMLERRGWRKDSLKVGDVVTVEGWRARDGSAYLRVKSVTRENGQVIGVPLKSIDTEY